MLLIKSPWWITEPANGGVSKSLRDARPHRPTPKMGPQQRGETRRGPDSLGQAGELASTDAQIARLASIGRLAWDSEPTGTRRFCVFCRIMHHLVSLRPHRQSRCPLTHYKAASPSLASPKERRISRDMELATSALDGDSTFRAVARP